MSTLHPHRLLDDKQRTKLVTDIERLLDDHPRLSRMGGHNRSNRTYALAAVSMTLERVEQALADRYLTGLSAPESEGDL